MERRQYGIQSLVLVLAEVTYCSFNISCVVVSLLHPVGSPGSGLCRNGAEERCGVLSPVEGDWLRDHHGGSFRRCEQLIDHNTRSLSLPLFCSVCICVSKGKNQLKLDHRKRVKA